MYTVQRRWIFDNPFGPKVDFIASEIDLIAEIFSVSAVSLDSTEVPSLSIIGIP